MNGREARAYIKDFTDRTVGEPNKPIGFIDQDGNITNLEDLPDLIVIHMAYLIYHQYEEELVQEDTKQ